jgi:hypothetical protein
MARFVILHTNSHVYVAVQAMIAQERFPRNLVFLTEYLNEGLGLVGMIDPAHDIIVITGDRIDGRNADEVAVAAKRIRPQALVFTYMVEDEERHAVNGRIPKDADTELLARFIRSIRDAGYDRDRLVIQFPEIEFTASSSPNA